LNAGVGLKIYQLASLYPDKLETTDSERYFTLTDTLALANAEFETTETTGKTKSRRSTNDLYYKYLSHEAFGPHLSDEKARLSSPIDSTSPLLITTHEEF